MLTKRDSSSGCILTFCVLKLSRVDEGERVQDRGWVLGRFFWEDFGTAVDEGVQPVLPRDRMVENKRCPIFQGFGLSERKDLKL